MNDLTTFLDFFSDVGGLRKDFELCGMVCKGHREIDKFADRSFRAIYDIKEDEWYAEDMPKSPPPTCRRSTYGREYLEKQDYILMKQKEQLIGYRNCEHFEEWMEQREMAENAA